MLYRRDKGRRRIVNQEEGGSGLENEKGKVGADRERESPPPYQKCGSPETRDGVGDMVCSTKI